MSMIVSKVILGGSLKITAKNSNKLARQKRTSKESLGCRTKVPRVFRIFVPNFAPKFETCSEYSPNFLTSFRAPFRGKRRPEKLHQKSPPFFNAKFPGEVEEKNPQKFSGERATLVSHYSAIGDTISCDGPR